MPNGGIRGGNCRIEVWNIEMNDAPTEALTELKRLRDSIDNIDAALIYILSERFKCTKQVGLLKAAYSLPPTDIERERQQIARLRQLAEDAQFDPVFAEKFLSFIIQEVIRHHESAARQSDASAPASSC